MHSQSIKQSPLNSSRSPFRQSRFQADPVFLFGCRHKAFSTSHFDKAFSHLQCESKKTSHAILHTAWRSRSVIGPEGTSGQHLSWLLGSNQSPLLEACLKTSSRLTAPCSTLQWDIFFDSLWSGGKGSFTFSLTMRLLEAIKAGQD